MPRFEQIKVHKEPLYSEGSPILIAASALLLDRSNAKNLAQVKLTSIDSREIGAVLIDVLPITPNGETGTKVEHYFQGLSVKSDDDFGQREAIPLTGSMCSDFSIAVRKVEFKNGEVWDAPAACAWGALPEKAELAPSDDVKEYQLIVGKQAIWVPYSFKDLWLCSCGQYNKSDLTACHHCQSKRKLVLLASSEETLRPAAETWRTERIAAERKKQEIAKAEARRKEEETAKKARRQGKVMGIVVAATCVAALAFFTTTKVIMPALDYSNAEKALASQDYETAWEEFSVLQDYRDSSQQAKAAASLKGDALLAANDYQEAIRWYELADNRESAKEAKYLYSKAHQTWNDEDTYSYLKELRGSGYNDASTIYDSLYKWSFSFSAIADDKDVSVAYSASGGEPGGQSLIIKFDVYVRSINGKWYQMSFNYPLAINPGPETTGTEHINRFENSDAVRITAYAGSDAYRKEFGTQELSL